MSHITRSHVHGDAAYRRDLKIHNNLGSRLIGLNISTNHDGNRTYRLTYSRSFSDMVRVLIHSFLVILRYEHRRARPRAHESRHVPTRA